MDNYRVKELVQDPACGREAEDIQAHLLVAGKEPSLPPLNSS